MDTLNAAATRLIVLDAWATELFKPGKGRPYFYSREVVATVDSVFEHACREYEAALERRDLPVTFKGLIQHPLSLVERALLITEGIYPEDDLS